MKPVKLLFILILGTFFSCSGSKEITDPNVVIKPTNPGEGSGTTDKPIQGICITVGQTETFTDADWALFANTPITDFIIIPKDASAYGSSESGYKTQLAPQMLDIFNKLVSTRNDARFWIGTPGITSKNFAVASTAFDQVYGYLNYLHDQIGSSLWKSNVGGIYMNMEAIYGTVDYGNTISNGCIKLISDLSSKIHNNLQTKFLWIPYYGYGSDPDEIIKRIAYVTNKSTLFDYVVIQPHYYFDGTVQINLNGIKSSILKQSVTFRDGSEVTPKVSKTAIGPEMELDWHIVPPNAYTDQLNRFNGYRNAFGEFIGKYPIIFYWDGTIKNALEARIVPFFNQKK